MSDDKATRYTKRRDFGRISSVIEMPNLVDIQHTSYNQFLQRWTEPEDRKDVGLQGVFNSVFPIRDFSECAELHFAGYKLEDPKFDVEECLRRDLTYAAPLKVNLRLVLFDVDKEIDKRTILNVKEQEVYMGDMPLMTDKGTFVVNGTERVVVSQMHRSPGVFFDHDKGKNHSSGKFLFAARIIPYRGSWLEFEFDAKDIVHVRIDRRRKIPVTSMLYALDYTPQDVLDMFYGDVACHRVPRQWILPVETGRLEGRALDFDLVTSEKGPAIMEKGQVFTRRKLRTRLAEGDGESTMLRAEDADIIGMRLAHDALGSGKEKIATAGTTIDAELLDRLASTLPGIEVFDRTHVDVCKPQGTSWKVPFDAELMVGKTVETDILRESDGSVVIETGTRLSRQKLRSLGDDALYLVLSADEMRGRVLATRVDSPESGDTLGQVGSAVTKADLTRFRKAGVAQIEVYDDQWTLSFTPISGSGWRVPFDTTGSTPMLGSRLSADLIDGATGEVVAQAGTKLTRMQLRRLAEKGLREQLVPDDYLYGRFLSDDCVDPETGLVHAEAGDEITPAMLGNLKQNGVDRLSTLDIDHVRIGPYIRDTLAADPNESREGALFSIYRVMRPGEPPTIDSAENLFKSLFFVRDRYDLSTVGRVKLNERLGPGHDEEGRVLTRKDIVACIRTLVELKDGTGDTDDIDHLGNRRVRSVGELLENQYRMSLQRMERAVRERMSLVELDKELPHDLINARMAASSVREFFGSSQLSQFMEQTNPLSEVTHKRRLSALGPGGLTRERAGFEVRDVHPTHYGRICPVETPEGPNIGLINSLATFARVNEYGFIESPYRKVIENPESGNRQVTGEVEYLTAMQERQHTIAQANVALNEEGSFDDDLVSCRENGEFAMTQVENVDRMDVSPKQLVSVAAALIPFLENDDANRALMGSNMQRQAVPLLRTEAPLVGTGLEELVARDSGATIVARRGGTVDQVDSQRIVIRVNEEEVKDHLGVDIYRLAKFQRSNQNTCIMQRPLVTQGQRVDKGDILCDGPSTSRGELALGRNILCAFMPWHGCNFEDSILVSERVVRDDVFTSIHIEAFEISARDTKLGEEEITRDLPNASEEARRQLDEKGIVHVGAEVQAGDILVGKISPKGETPTTPEEKLLRAIFGEKASEVRDTSLRVPPGVNGTVVDVRMFSRKRVETSDRQEAIQNEEVVRLEQDRTDEQAIISRIIHDSLRKLLTGKTVKRGPSGFRTGEEITSETLDAANRGQWWNVNVTDADTMSSIKVLRKQFDNARHEIDERYTHKKRKMAEGDELGPGVLHMVKVFIAVKRKLQAGDKMAGRHGNKGVISRIVPIEDMPYLEDGTPVDIVLNPLGLPSRMNVGQILETHLGWAAAGIGRKIGRMYDMIQSRQTPDKERPKILENLRGVMSQAYGETNGSGAIGQMGTAELLETASDLVDGVPIATPVFDGANEQDIADLLELAGLSRTGKEKLVDGRTGEPFGGAITVGYLYVMKLHHLVDDKIHARSVGAYSLVTQQPLGGKAQFGGQRFGEMEVWALQAYGAAYTLQEILTVKSDDVAGRSEVYESIVKGDNNFRAGIPESFNVLVKEMQALCLNVDRQQVN